MSKDGRKRNRRPPHEGEGVPRWDPRGAPERERGGVSLISTGGSPKFGGGNNYIAGERPSFPTEGKVRPPRRAQEGNSFRKGGGNVQNPQDDLPC